MHPALQPLEAGSAVVVERDDLAVEHRLVHPERGRRGRGPRDRRSVISLRLRLSSRRPSGLHVRDRPHPVPLDLERPLTLIARKRRRRPGHHRYEPFGHRLSVRIRGRIHPVDHPVVRGVAGLPDREQAVAPAQPLAMEGDLDLLLLPLVHVERALVPDRHRAGAVLTLRDLTVELEVLERVVLGAHREPVLRRVRRDPVRDRPRRERPIVLEAQVPVQAGGVVLLHDEPVLVTGAVAAGRLGRRGEVALGAVARELVLLLGSGHSRG